VQLIDAVASGLHTVELVARGTRVATVGTAWSGRVVPAVAASAASMLAWPGQLVRVHIAPGALRPGLVSDDRVGTVSVSVGDERGVVVVRLTRGVRGPSVGWRLERY